MKNTFLSAILIAFVLVSCNQKNKQEESTNSTMMEHDSTMKHQDSKMKDATTKLYACPMHPEVQGKLNDTCSKCGMQLTEEVK